MNPIELNEEEPKTLTPEQFDREAARLLRNDPKKRVSVEVPNILDNRYVLKSNGWVGFLPLTDKYALHIKPKVENQNLFRMLEYAYKLESFEFLKGDIRVTSVEDIFENLASILAKKIIDRSRKGLYLDYVNREEDLSNLRGKIEFIPSYLSISRGKAYLRCNYSEQTLDLIENQILLWTIYRLRKHQFKRVDVAHLLNIAYRELVDKIDIITIRPNECINRLYNRLNQDYESMHILCRFFLEHSGPGTEVGDEDFLPFMLDMPLLFERFVAEWLEINLPKKFTNVRLEKQYKFDLDDKGDFSFLIDLVIKDSTDQSTLAVLDTKYKQEKATSTDISKVIAYASSMKTNKAFLIYPEKLPKEVNLISGPIHVKDLFFEINNDIEKNGEVFLENLKNKLYE